MMIVSVSSRNRERNAWNMQPLPLACLSKQPTKLLPRAFQFVRERARIVNLAKRFDDGRGINRDSTRLGIGQNTIEHESLNVAVENDANKFVFLSHHQAAAVAHDDIAVRNEIEIHCHVQAGYFVDA